MARTLSPDEARRAYDRIGAVQDRQAFYEDPATEALLEHGDFRSARAVFEFGCGTGRFAQRLFRDFLPPTARYRGTDLSPVMVRLARSRLEPYASRAAVLLTDGGPPVGGDTAAYDRFVSNYVFDLLSEADAHGVVREAYRMLEPGGLLCLSGLSTGVGPASRAVRRVWSWVQRVTPALVGGCRPVELLPYLSGRDWRVRYHQGVVAWAIPSEVVVAQRL